MIKDWKIIKKNQNISNSIAMIPSIILLLPGTITKYHQSRSILTVNTGVLAISMLLVRFLLIMSVYTFLIYMLYQLSNWGETACNKEWKILWHLTKLSTHYPLQSSQDCIAELLEQGLWSIFYSCLSYCALASTCWYFKNWVSSCLFALI